MADNNDTNDTNTETSLDYFEEVMNDMVGNGDADTNEDH